MPYPSLIAYARAFLGRQRVAPAPDLLPRERLAILFLVVVLVAVGVAPSLVLEPAAALLGS